MYIANYYDRTENVIYNWDDTKGYRAIPYRRRAFKVSKNGKYRTIYGDPVTPCHAWRKADVEAGMLYESDIDPLISFLVDEYLDEDDVSPEHRILYYDIEVERGDAYSLPKDAENRINAISAYDTKTKKYHVWVLLDQPSDAVTSKDGVLLKTFDTEESLLEDFLYYWRTVDPTIITGWNIDYFDNPYLVNRLNNVFGKGKANVLSSIGIVTNKNGKVVFAGRTSFDYLILYKKFITSREVSYKLDYIANKVLGRGKVEYDGTLDTLFRTDIDKFIEYSVTDTELIVEMDKVLKFIDLSLTVCHQCHVPYDYIYYSSFYLDGALLTYCRRNKIVLPNKIKIPTNGDSAMGAYVKTPQSGLHKWVYDLDLKALYPSTIQSYNISPETKVGKVIGWDEERFAKKEVFDVKVVINSRALGTSNSRQINLNSIELKKFLEKNKLMITSNGILYRSDIEGILPKILKEWANERDLYKNKMKEYKRAGDDKKTQYYNLRQHAKKIQSNSLYGVLLLKSFRFYDMENGEAITISSRKLIQFTSKVANVFYNTKSCYGSYPDNHDFCIYTDTDSVFFPAQPLIPVDLDSLPEDQAIAKTIECAGIVQSLINKSYDKYAKELHNCDKHYFIIKQELVSKRALWMSRKKRYIQWVVNEEGVPVDKLDIKGLDVVRSDFPEIFSNFMKGLFVDILNDCKKEDVDKKIGDFKRNIKNINIWELMCPTSVQTLSQYDNRDSIFKFNKGTPIHYKAALAYNDILKLKKLSNYRPIMNGDKIKWAYLRENEFGIDTLALTGDGDPPLIVDFVEKYINREKIMDQLLVSKLEEFYKVLNWGHINFNYTNKFF